MTEATKISPEELQRREDYWRAYQRPRNLMDPFTWDYPYKTALVGVTICLLGIRVHNYWMRKPWSYGLYVRTAGVGIAAVSAYWAGKLREHHYRTRDAVLDHYRSLHEDDFITTDEVYGRPFAEVLLPWFPNRPTYIQHDLDSDDKDLRMGQTHRS